MLARLLALWRYQGINRWPLPILRWIWILIHTAGSYQQMY
ncbi:hypothetical protein OLEAN_C18180 [Oleispira antarctica RB-8]|uniref:Uncharacterized protein n=1 Tax=Oleispira antarctica RB-8 TaxID=698738 RepID=R4YTR3_OLEAN|nr:hypothetical protein OLEAN_C18180 [Oleispira antarctica RB-8]